MKKIIFYINALGRGGAERVVSNLAEQLSQDEYDVTIAMCWQADNEYPLPQEVKKEYVGLPQDTTKGRFAILRSRLGGLRRLLKREKPDMLIVFSRSAIYRAMLAKAFLKVPMIITVRTDPRSEYVGLKNRILRIFLENIPDGCVFQTEEAKSFFSKGLQEKSTIIPNPINPQYLNVERLEQRNHKIVTFGRLVRLKNHQMLVEAFADIHPQFPDYKLEIYGTGEADGTEDVLTEIIRERHLEEYVLLMGNTNDPQKILSTASLFVLSSNYEGMPNALLEAMVMGVPCISTDCPCGGPRTVIQNGVNGMLIPVGDKQGLEDAMIQLLSNPDSARQMGQEAMKIVSLVNPQTVYQQWKEYINSIIQKR